MSMQPSPRSRAAGIAIVVFVLFIFITGATDRVTDFFSREPDFPDFSNYIFLRKLSPDEFPIRAKHDRIIAVGDIHGMNSSLSALLAKLSYDPESDTLIHLGDIVTKGGVKGSLAVLSFMVDNDIMGVRGNNDQTVIEWRAWRDWIQSLPGGREWLDSLDSQHSLLVEADDEGDEDDARADLHPGPAFWSQGANKDWENKIPKGWKLFKRHYNVARAMTQAHYDYLRSLPAVMHAPAGHTFFVHAGMLAADPTQHLMHPSQPLSHWPAARTSKPEPHVLRGLQEAALLRDIPQNRDPWVLLNMRSVWKDGSISEKKKGTFWAELWNDVMDMCGGLDADLSSSVSESQYPLSAVNLKKKSLPCFPPMVVYGHTASRGLDARRWSVGLDTGCVNKGRLSALVLDKGSFLDLDENEDLERDAYLPEHSPFLQLEYGDSGRAHIVSVKC